MELDQNRPLDALALAERARGLSLTASTGACQDDDDLDARLRCWTAQLARETAVVSYVVLPDRLAIWVLTRDGMRIARQPIAAERLREMVRDYRRTLERAANGTSPDDAARASAALFDQLILPIASVDSRQAAPRGRRRRRAARRAVRRAVRCARAAATLLEDHIVELSPA